MSRAEEAIKEAMQLGEQRLKLGKEYEHKMLDRKKIVEIVNGM